MRVLEIGDRTVAATMNAIHGDCLYFVQASWDERFARDAPMHLLLVDCLQEATRRRLRRFDLNVYYPYKAEYCREILPLLDLQLLPDRAPGLVALAGDSALRGLRVAVRDLVRSPKRQHARSSRA